MNVAAYQEKNQTFRNGPYTYTTTFTLFSVVSAAPTAPRNVQTSAVAATAITVQWVEPATANGVIRGYNITHNLADSVTTVSSSERAALFTDLLPFTFYEFTVYAFTIEAGPEVTVSARTEEAGLFSSYYLGTTVCYTYQHVCVLYTMTNKPCLFYTLLFSTQQCILYVYTFYSSCKVSFFLET